MNGTAPAGEPRPLAMLRRFLLAILALGLAGTLTELVLLRHDEGGLQWIPLVLIGLAMATVLWRVVRGGRASLVALELLMLVFPLAGIAGMALHFRANVEFQTEIDPSMSGWTLFTKAIHAKAPPALAPGAMIQLGLIGLAYAYRHPDLSRTADPSSSPFPGE